MSDDLHASLLNMLRGPRIDREPENPEGVPELQKIIDQIDSSMESLADAWDSLKSLRESIEETRDRWEGKPLYGPGPFEITSTPLIDRVKAGPGLMYWGRSEGEE